jgi:hypothetical protein
VSNPPDLAGYSPGRRAGGLADVPIAAYSEPRHAGQDSGPIRAELYELMVDAVPFRRHHWFSQLGIHPVPGPGTLRYAAIVLESLTGCGLDEPTAINVLATLNNYISGFVQREQAWQDLLGRDRAPDRWPQAAAAGGTGRPAGGPAPDRDLSARLTLSGDEGFAFGLDRFLDGIAVLLSRRGLVQGG